MSTKQIVSKGSKCWSEPSSEDVEAWLQRVRSAQCERMTPQQRAQLQRRADRSRDVMVQAKKCKALKDSAVRSHVLAHEALQQISSASSASAERRPGACSAVSERWQLAQEASEERQERVLSRLRGVSAMEVIDVAEDSDEEEEQCMAEVAQIVGARESPAMAAPMEAIARAPDAAFEGLLAQLRTEPDSDEERAAKFQLFEGYAQQMEKTRKSLVDFHTECETKVPPAVARGMALQMKQIDSHDAMSIPNDDGRTWCAYHMMRATEQNNRAMAAVLGGLQKKLEQLEKNDQTDCPVCLEPFAAEGPRVPETLSCCHKLCQECWVNWKQVTHGAPFCPLCRHEEFLGVVTDE